MRFLKSVLAVAVVATLIINDPLAVEANTRADRKNTRDLNKVESELEDAQARLENVKQRLSINDNNNINNNNNNPESLSEKLHDVMDTVKDKFKRNKNDITEDDHDILIQKLGQESITERATRRIRETFGRETLVDNAQRYYNDARQALHDDYISSGQALDNLGEETVTERTARRVREILGTDTTRDKLQRKYSQAKHLLLEAKELDFTAVPDKISYLKEKITKLAQEVQDKFEDKVEDDETIWYRIKDKLGFVHHEPTPSEKALLIAQHIKEQAIEKKNQFMSAQSHLKYSFLDFCKKLGRKPIDAVHFVRQWIESDPADRVAVRRSKIISSEAHDALDDLLIKLLEDVGEDNVDKIQKIEIEVDTKNIDDIDEKKKIDINSPASFINNIQNKIYGTIDSEINHEDDITKHGSTIKERVNDIIHNTKEKIDDALPSSFSELYEESYAQKAARKLRSTLGQSTFSDKLYEAREEGGLYLDGFNKHTLSDFIHAHLPERFQNKKEYDIKKSLSELGEESYTEKAARKVRESLGKDTYTDTLHAILDNIRAGSVKNTISEKYDDVKDMLSSFSGESRMERIARKIRQALGRETMLDIAHQKVDDAVLYYHSLHDGISSESIKQKMNDMKDSVYDTASNVASSVSEGVQNVKDKMNAESVQPKKGKLASIRDAVFGDAKDNKIEQANKMLQQAIKKLEEAKKMN